MSANTPPRFDYLNQLPCEIREIIFGFMIRDTLEPYEQKETPRPHTLGDPSDGFPLVGFDAFAMIAHLDTSPWVTLNKQYCVEYLKVLLKEVEIHVRIPNPCLDSSEQHTGSVQKRIDGILLQSIDKRFSIAASSQAGTESPKKSLWLHSKGVCSIYYYEYTFFERGFGKKEHRHFPPEDHLIKPVKLLRRCHEKYNIPADKLSIEIWYGDPSWPILACCEQLDNLHHTVVSLRPLHAKIYVEDFATSIAVIAGEIDVLRRAFGKVVERMRERYWHDLSHVLELQTMVEADMEWIREKHVRILLEVTNFWKARDGWYDWDEMFRITGDAHKHRESATTLEERYKTSQPSMATLSTTNSLQRLPREIRDLATLRRHLLTAPCLALNKQFCAEYLIVLLKSLDAGIRTENSETLEDCLFIISLYLKITSTDQKETWTQHVKPITLYRTTYSSYIKRNKLSLFSNTSVIYYVPTTIPSTKLSLILDYGDALLVLKRLIHIPDVEDTHLASYLDSLNFPLQPRIHLTDSQASVLALDRELQRLKDKLHKVLDPLRQEYGDYRCFDDAEKAVEKDLKKLWRLHVRTVEKVVYFWEKDTGSLV
ncbi:hypothetical protein KCU71_g3386, partial [Aureobasidium melanogenum]